MRLSAKYILLTFILALGLILIGCGGSEDNRADTETYNFEPGHEAHDHGPGEHVNHSLDHSEHENAAHSEESAETLDWCSEHSVPESECTKCNPEMIAHFKQTGDWCAGHDLPESHCRLCNPEIKFPQEEIILAQSLEHSNDEIIVSMFFRPNTEVCATNDALIQFASKETAERVGLSVQQVRADTKRMVVEAPAEVVFDETSSTVVTSTLPALVSSWRVAPGDMVHEGDIIAIVQSPEIAELQAELLTAHAADQLQQKEAQRHKELKARNLISDSDYERQVAQGEKTRADYISTRGLLESAGMNQRDIDRIISTKKVTNQFSMRAPTDGIVVDRTAQIGELMSAGRAFLQLADPSQMWIEASLTEEQIRQVEVGQDLTFSSDGRGLSQVGGKIIWVSRFLDRHARTGTVRARVLDPNHNLSAGEFGRVQIIKSESNRVALVPKDAVQWEGCCNVVFVKESADRYRPRKIEFMDGEGPFYQVTEGLEAGEEVVVNGSFLLKTELKKTSIGAGCCGLEPTS